MIWFLLLFLFWIESSSLTYHTNCTNMTNITAEDYCTNVTCTDTLCSNNTCVYGYYNNTQDCVICSTLRNQYNAERCCDRYSVTSSPFSELIIDSIYVNDTGTVLIRYTPPRDICHHLWTEWGKCPEICDNVLPGGYCTMNIDCKDTNECKDFCCYIRDHRCLSCANETGYCAQCEEGLGFNATGNYTCQECPSYTLLYNNTCNLFTNCSAGEYVIANATNVTDRVCSTVPEGYFTNETNALEPIPWTNCSGINNTWTSFTGNATHDAVCSNHTQCEVTDPYIWYGNETHDAMCESKYCDICD